MSLTVVVILFLQVVLTWGITPLLAGLVSAIRMRDKHWILQPYRDLMIALTNVDQIEMLAWSLIMVLVLLVPVITLRAPLDWMADMLFMWFVLVLGQLLVVAKKQRFVVILGAISLLVLLLSAMFVGGALQNTAVLSNGLLLMPIAKVIALILLLVSLLFWSGILQAPYACLHCATKARVFSKKSQTQTTVMTDNTENDHQHSEEDRRFSLAQWILWTSVWLLILWGSALCFPLTVSVSTGALSLLIACGYVLLKFIAAILILTFANWFHQKVGLYMTLLMLSLLIVIGFGCFAYLVLA